MGSLETLFSFSELQGRSEKSQEPHTRDQQKRAFDLWKYVLGFSQTLSTLQQTIESAGSSVDTWL